MNNKRFENKVVSVIGAADGIREVVFKKFDEDVFFGKGVEFEYISRLYAAKRLYNKYSFNKTQIQ